MKTDKSRELFDRLSKFMPGANTRWVTHYEPYPVAIDHGCGCRIWDVDANEYIDLLNNYSPLVHGHAHPVITEAISRQAARGTVFPSPTALQAELAERICSRIPHVEQVRFTNSGSESVLMALRAARAFTGRDELIMSVGGFHGSWEQVAVEPRFESGGVLSAAAYAPRGVPEPVAAMMHFVRFNDSDDLERLMEECGSRIAAIVLEPILGHTLVPGEPQFMRAARKLATKHGALLVMDEVITSRLSVSGWTATMGGIAPDLTTLGKTIGGGLPLAAFGGKADIMQIFDPRRPDVVSHHGTFNGNDICMAAGCASVDMLDQQAIDRINSMGDRLSVAMSRVGEELGAKVTVSNVGSLLHAYADEPGAFHRACLKEGLYMAPRGGFNLSTVMDDAVMEEVVAAWRRALEVLLVKENQETLQG